MLLISIKKTGCDELPCIKGFHPLLSEILVSMGRTGCGKPTKKAVALNFFKTKIYEPQSQCFDFLSVF